MPVPSSRPSTSSPAGVDAVVLAGGDPVDADLARQLPAGALVVAADAGLALAAVLGLDVDLLVGDLDSVEPGLLADAEAAGVRIERHPTAKDATDLALAMDAAVAAGADRLTVVGGAGGRADHLLANALLLASEAYAGCVVRSWSRAAAIEVVQPGRTTALTGPVGATVSLLPIHGRARGVTTAGLRFPLAGEDLAAGSTRGVSNELVAPQATVELTGGVLLAVRPLPDPGGPT